MKVTVLVNYRTKPAYQHLSSFCSLCLSLPLSLHSDIMPYHSSTRSNLLTVCT